MDKDYVKNYITKMINCLEEGCEQKEVLKVARESMEKLDEIEKIICTSNHTDWKKYRTIYQKFEIVRDVVGYEGLYSIDIFGQVTKLSNGHVMKQIESPWGYMKVSLTKDNKQTQYAVHKLIAETFIPNPLNKKQVNHIDGNKTNNIVWNLEWVTPKENILHAADTGLSKGKKVRIVETGEVFNTIGSCARKIGGNAGDISRCLCTNKSITHKGYHFEYID